MAIIKHPTTKAIEAVNNATIIQDVNPEYSETYTDDAYRIIDSFNPNETDEDAWVALDWAYSVTKSEKALLMLKEHYN